jgi:tetratricopeptide (TPR) repeat protein
MKKNGFFLLFVLFLLYGADLCAQSTQGTAPPGEAPVSVMAQNAAPQVAGQPAQSGAQPATQRVDALQNYYIGRDLEYRGQANEAQPYYNEAVRQCFAEIEGNRITRNTYTALTWTLQRQRKYDSVINWGEKGLRVYPNDYRLLEVMGEAYFYLNNWDRSLGFMQRYVNIVPQSERASVAYFFIGEIFRLRKRFHHADIAYTVAVRLEPNMALWWYRLGSVREATGSYTSAVEAYEQALKIYPSYREANEGLERIRRG